MSSNLEKSWGAFPANIAQKYLKTFGHPSHESKQIMLEIIEGMKFKNINIIDLGCGNANLAEYFSEKNLSFFYTGVDFSNVLLDAAKKAYPDGLYVKDDVNILSLISKKYDIACYSHVIEMLPSPESSLLAASKFASKIIIRFFEPPSDRADWVELLEMDIGTNYTVPYLRRKMSLDYYRLLLNKIKCKSVDIYRTSSKDEVHVLYF